MNAKVHHITITLSPDQAEALDAMARRLTLEPAEAAEVAVSAALGAYGNHETCEATAPQEPGEGAQEAGPLNPLIDDTPEETLTHVRSVMQFLSGHALNARELHLADEEMNGLNWIMATVNDALDYEIGRAQR